MKKKLPASLILTQFSFFRFSLTNLHSKVSCSKTKLSFLFFLFCISLWAQQPPFTTSGSMVVPAGITQVNVSAWGGGGSGGGASPTATNGRSGGGGGGGAYATQSNIAVTPGNTLNVVVGAGGAASTGNGNPGGNSTITELSGSIFAAGGAGGTGNGGAGGAGGTVAASKGSTITAGGNGTNGGSVLLGLLLGSGTGGNGGTPNPGASGGAGGAGHPTVLLTTLAGNAGGELGGGGGGAVSASNPQNGGAGARGQVNVVFTCPTYTLANPTTALNACVTTGTSSVTLSSTAAGLPVGPYVVTYNTTNPTQNLTATITVTTPGTLNFTATGLTTPGTSIITVTNLTSAVCSSNISTNNSATITVSPATVGGAVSGGTTICSGATSAALSLTGNVGSVLRWESSVSPFSTWTPITNTTTSYTSGALTQTTQFRAVIQSGTCSAVNSNATTVTVNPLPQGSLTANGPFCATGAGQLTFTSTAGTGPFTVVYTENGGTNRTATGVVSGTAFTPFTTPVTATTTYALVSVTDANSCIRSTGFTGSSASITVNPLPQGSLSAVSPLCGSGAGQLTFTSTAGTGPFTVVYTENGGTNRTATGVVSGTAFTPFTTPVTATTTYALVSVTDANSCIRSTGFTGASAAITVNPLPQGSLSAVSPLCGSGAGQLTFTSTAGTGPFTVVYTENGGANRTATGVVSGTSFTPFTTPVTATTTYTLVSVTDANSCIRNTGFTGASAVITVNPLPQGSLSAVSPLCGSGAGQLTFTSTAGTGPFTVVYTENGGTNRTATGVVSGTAFTPFTTPVTATTTYALVSVTDANSCIRSTGFTGASAVITVNPLPQGTLSAVSPLCGSGAGQLTFTSTAGTGPFTIVYTENGGANRTATGVVSGTAFTPFTTPVTATTTYALVSVTDANSCIRSSGFTANSAIITVNPIPAPSFTVSPAASVCVETNVTYTTQSGQTNYIWTVPGTQGTDYDIISGSLSLASNTVTLHWHTIGSKTVTVGYSSNGCTSAINASSTTTVVKTERGVVHGGTHICAGSPSPLLTLNDYAGTIVRWEYAEAIPYVWQPISHTADTYQPGILTTSTSYRAVIQNGTCPEEGSIETRIDVEPKPAAPVPGTVVQPTCVNSVGSITLNGLLTSGNWTITQSNGTLSQTYTGSGPSFTVTNLLPGIYTFTIYENPICPSSPTAGIEIAAPSTNVWNGTSWSKGSEPVITDAIRFSGDYSTTGNLSGCSCMIDSGVNVTVNSNHTLTITNAVTNDGGILTFENNSSLLQTANAINTGNIIYKRNTSTRRYDYTYWSSPIVRTPAYTLHDLSPNTLSDKYTSYNPNASWVISYGGVLEMIPGQGYSIRGPQNFDIVTPAIQEVSFIGVPNNGTISVPLVAAERFHLIGNPYPSAVYADQFIFDNAANLYGTLYFWTHNSPPAGDASGTYKYNSADYAIYNISGSTSVGNLSGQGAGSPGNQTAPLGYIAAGQSFFVKSKTTSSAIFTNAMRVPGSNSQFYKTNNSNKTNLERHRVWLNLTNTEGAFKQVLIGYIEGATNFWDQNYDAISFNGNPYVDFYSINEGQKLVIQGRALPFNESDVIPLGYRSAIQGEFTISIDHTDGVLSNQAIYLEDKVTNTIHNLQTSNYNFTTAIGTFPERFILKYTNTSLGVDDFENQTNSFYVSVKAKTIKLNSTEDVMREVSIFDISGKLLYNNKKVENTEFQISNFQSGNQVLIVKVTLENGNIITKKIVFN
ncbi:T9SS sorting signal type C domain-containing protein [Flavobacterium sp. 22076]|uniref:T9SS sorting signal type C domain-containing protein n=3 Tax=unclassified Flavobacterium TaxID=196869 RepID=UPI003F85C2F7